MILEIIEAWNQIAWALTNLIILYIGIALVVFVIGYAILFDPKATTGGKLIFRFALSLTGIILLVVIGIFVDPATGREWFTYPGDAAWWRQTLRFIVYSGVAFTVTNLSIFLVKRKWFPHKLKTAKSLDLVKPRHETSEIPIVTEGENYGR